MSKRLKMPARLATDGAVNIAREGEQMDQIVITVTSGVGTSQVRMSEYNAWRVFGVLAVLLEIPLSAEAGKAIRL